MAASKRVTGEPAFVLHRHDWSESSLVLEMFTREFGRIALVAKGVKRPSSGLRPVLLPLQPLQIAFGGDGEIRTLRAAEWQGGYVMPGGEALLSGYYLNELVLTLLARDDAHPRLFEVYADTVEVLAGQYPDALQTALRAFELLLLREIGVLPRLDIETSTLKEVEDAASYALVAEGGLRLADPQQDRHSLPGRQWRMLQGALVSKATFTDALRACAELNTALKPQLRAMLHYHCGVHRLRTRQMMIDLQSL